MPPLAIRRLPPPVLYRIVSCICFRAYALRFAVAVRQSSPSPSLKADSSVKSGSVKSRISKYDQRGRKAYQRGKTGYGRGRIVAVQTLWLSTTHRPDTEVVWSHPPAMAPHKACQTSTSSAGASTVLSPGTNPSIFGICPQGTPSLFSRAAPEAKLHTATSSAVRLPKA